MPRQPKKPAKPKTKIIVKVESDQGRAAAALVETDVERTPTGGIAKGFDFLAFMKRNTDDLPRLGERE